MFDLFVGCMVGLIGLDGVGKFSLLLLVVGVCVLQDGVVCVLGSDMVDCCVCVVVGLCIVYML